MSQESVLCNIFVCTVTRKFKSEDGENLVILLNLLIMKYVFDLNNHLCAGVSADLNAATAGEDFIEVTAMPVVIQPGRVFPNVSITIINDNLTELAENVQLSITTEMPRIDIFPDTQTFRILDDDRKFILCNLLF